MIASFRHRGLRALYEGRTVRRVAPEHVSKLLDILAVLDRSSGPGGVDLPGFRLHTLSGTMKGHYAVTVSANSRSAVQRVRPHESAVEVNRAAPNQPHSPECMADHAAHAPAQEEAGS